MSFLGLFTWPEWRATTKKKLNSLRNIYQLGVPVFCHSYITPCHTNITSYYPTSYSILLSSQTRLLTPAHLVPWIRIKQKQFKPKPLKWNEPKPRREWNPKLVQRFPLYAALYPQIHWATEKSWQSSTKWRLKTHDVTYGKINTAFSL